MKKILIVTLLVTSGMIAKAQTSAGTIMLGGGFNFSSSTEETAGDDLQSSSFSLVPSAGFFISDNFAIGIDLGFTSNKYSNDDKETSFQFSPYARFYKFLVEEKFAIYGQGGIYFESGKYDPDAGNETKTGAFGIYAAPGFAYFFNEKWSLDFQLRGLSFVSSDPNKDGDDDKEKSFNFGANSFNPTLGFRYFISK